MTMQRARLQVVLVGLVLPYAARVPRGWAWFAQYLVDGPLLWLFMGAFNAIAWGAVLALTRLYKYPVSVLFPAIIGFAPLAFAHYSLDLTEDAQSAIGLVIFPVYALVPIAVGGAIGYLVDRWLRARAAV